MTNPPRCPVEVVTDASGRTRSVIRLDPHQPEFAADNYAIYEELRPSHPIAWSTECEGFWMLLDYKSVFRATRDSDRFISSQGITLDDRVIKYGNASIPAETDPPELLDYRKVTLGVLSLRSIMDIEGDIRRIADEHIDSFIENGEADLVTELTTPLPARMILRVLGLDESRWSEWIPWVHDMFHGDMEAAQRAQGFLFEELSNEINRRQQLDDPGDDVLGAIMKGTVNGEPLSFMEQVRYVVLLLVGGMDTTSGLTANSLIHINAQPELRKALIDHPEMMATAVEEFLRFDTPTHGLARRVASDTEFNGQTFKKGEKLMLMWASANRDPAEFENPEVIDIERHPNRHLTFGSGAHKCLGQHLARASFRVMLEQILRRLPDFELTVDEVPRFPNAAHVYAPTSFPVRFTRGERVSATAS